MVAATRWDHGRELRLRPSRERRAASKRPNLGLMSGSDGARSPSGRDAHTRLCRSGHLVGSLAAGEHGGKIFELVTSESPSFGDLSSEQRWSAVRSRVVVFARKLKLLQKLR